MKWFYSVLLLLAVTAPVQAQIANTNVLAAIDSISVYVGFSVGEDAASCTPLESTIKTRIELRLRRAGIRVVDVSAARMIFSAVSIHPGLCAVSYDTRVLYLYFLPSIDEPFDLVGLLGGGIMSDGEFSSSRDRIRQIADDAADLVINEILEAKQ